MKVPGRHIHIQVFNGEPITPGGDDLPWSTINGGEASIGSGYTLMSTIGQPDVGVGHAQAGDLPYILIGGLT